MVSLQQNYNVFTNKSQVPSGPLAAIYARVSGESQEIDGTSLDTQISACFNYAQSNNLQIAPEYIIRETFSGLTIKRPGLDKLLHWIRSKTVQAIIIYSTDRFSRNGFELLTLIRECDAHDVALHCVTEDLMQGEIGELLNFVRGWASHLEASKISERTMRGKRKIAQEGGIPCGFGRYGGYLGLRYDKASKRLVHIPGQIEIAREILHRTLSGESSSSITIDLQQRGVVSAGGGNIHRSSVNRVRAHALVYAGVIDWDGIKIRGKIEPIITEEEAWTILTQLKRNKEESYGYGRQKWLTGRVTCGVCGRRYWLDVKKGCFCAANDRRSPISCESPKIGWRELEKQVWHAAISVLHDPYNVVQMAQKKRQEWESEQWQLDQRKEQLKNVLAEFGKRRRLLSFQHEMGGLSNDEYADRLGMLRREEERIRDELSRLERFQEPPPTPHFDSDDAMRAFIESCDFQYQRMMDAGNEVTRRDIAKKLDLRVTVLPDPAHDYRLEMFLELPIDNPSNTGIRGTKIAVTASKTVTPSTSRSEYCHSLQVLCRIVENETISILVGTHKPHR